MTLTNIMDLMEKKIALSEDLITRKVDETLLVYKESSGDLYEFNETSEIVINMLDEEKEIKTIFEKLCDIYEGDKKEMQYDFLTLIEQLLELGVISVLL